MEIRKFQTEIRISGTRQPKIVGKIPYDSKSNFMGFYEVLKPGCFSKSLRSGEKIKALHNHEAGKPLANSTSGTLQLRDFSTHLEVEIRPDVSISWAKDCVESVRRGDIDGLSFGFTVNSNGENWPDASTRELTSINLIEVSPVCFAAYPESEVNVRKNKKGSRKMEYKTYKTALAALLEAGNNALSEDREHPTADENRQLTIAGFAYDHFVGYERPDAPKFLEDGFVAVRDFWNRSKYAPIKPDPNPGSGNIEGRQISEMETRQTAIFDKYIIGGDHAITPEERGLMNQRALSMGQDVQGGFLVALEQFTNQVITKMKDLLFFMKYAEVIECENAHSLGYPSLDHDPGSHNLAFTAEIKTGDEDSDMDFGKRALYPKPLARRVKINNKLLRAAIINIQGLVRDRVTYVFNTVLEYQFFQGTGANAPLGVMTADGNGVDTDRDCSTGNNATGLTADGLLEAAFFLKSQYLANARWVFHRNGVKKIRKLKSGDGDYLFQPSLVAGTPAMLVGMPISASEYMPDVWTANKYVGVLADFSYYKIAIALNMQIQVLTELYAETNQTGIIARMEIDGMPGLSEAFCRIQLGS